MVRGKTLSHAYSWARDPSRSKLDQIRDAHKNTESMVRSSDPVVIDRESKCHEQGQCPQVMVDPRLHLCNANIVSPDGYVVTWNITCKHFIVIPYRVFLFVTCWQIARELRCICPCFRLGVNLCSVMFAYANKTNANRNSSNNNSPQLTIKSETI